MVKEVQIPINTKVVYNPFHICFIMYYYLCLIIFLIERLIEDIIYKHTCLPVNP